MATNINSNLYLNYEDDSIKEFEIMKKFKSNNVFIERIKLYEDFSINLLYLIYNTYLGKEYIKSKSDIEGHFNWCYGKILEEFDDQEISFYGNDDLYNYFFKYYYDQFYKLNEPLPIKIYSKLWNGIFNYKLSNKPKSEFNLFTELYKIFDVSIDQKHRVLEENKF